MKEIPRWLCFFPRILAILFAAFLMLFSFDVYSPGMSIPETLLAFLMHNIPVIILVVIIILSWERELIGAICFLIAGLFYMGLTGNEALKHNTPLYISLGYSLFLSGPAFLIAFLYFLCWKRKNPPD